jgi:rhamnosyltransferase
MKVARIQINEKKIPSVDNICALVVTYNPDQDIVNRVKLISKQVGLVIIVDNTEIVPALDPLNILSNDKNIHIIRNRKNLGVATALNIGFNYAINSCVGMEWCLTLDQDTFVSDDIVDQLISVYKQCEHKEEIGIIGSNYQEWTTGRILHTPKQSENVWEEVNHLPTSGSLTSILNYKQVGKFRDEFFIDYVDTEYCFRLKDAGCKLLITNSVCMKHPLGYYRRSHIYEILFSRSMVTNYPAFRHYYWTRNGVKLCYERYKKDFSWAAKELIYLLIRRPITIFLFETDKFQKIKFILLAIYHTVNNRFNKI